MNTFTESTIRQYSESGSFARGREYYKQGAVDAVVRRGDTIQAEVEGSEYEPYDVSATLLATGGIVARCSCPYEGGGWCKHIVAVLLHCLNEPEEVENLPMLENLVASLDRAALLTLLLNLARSNPKLVLEIELEIANLKPQPALTSAGVSPTPPPRTPVDVSAIRRKTRAALKIVSGSENYEWDDNGEEILSELEEEVYPLIEIAEAAREAGAGSEALAVLEAITDELVKGWEDISDIIYDASDLFSDLGRAWAEAFLTMDLTERDRLDWIKRFESWQKVKYESGSSDRLQVAVEAARQGWDYPPLVRVLQGEITGQGAWDGERPDCADDLASARLNILERQGRLQEAAYLAEAEGQVDRYMGILVRLGRMKEAVDYGMKHLATTDSALALAKTLHECRETALALQTAEHGLSLQGYRYTLAIWLRDTALTAGDAETAIRAAMSGLKENPELADYLRLQEFADEKWDALREEILTTLRESGSLSASSKADIFLHEGLYEDALNAVRGNWSGELVARVVEAVTPYYPFEVIPICKEQAARIMDAGKASHYDDAAQWVGRVRVAYLMAGRMTEWQEYRAELLATHQRKYKLVPLLREI